MLRKVVLALMVVGILSVFGLAQVSDDGSVPWPTDSLDMQIVTEEIEELDRYEPNFWWRVDWYCFKECWKKVYDACIPSCEYFRWSPKLYSWCLKGCAAYATAVCLRACWK